jgi:uncharacterized protein
MEYSGFYDFALKEIGEEGGFEGYASTFGGPPDLQGDIVAQGAFAETIDKHKGKWPLLMGHIVSRIVGFSTHAEETDRGLLLRGEFTLASDEGRNAYATAQHAARVGHKLGLSIGYGIRKNGAVLDEQTGVRTLKGIDVFEVSIAALPANSRARIARVKSAGDWTVREIEDALRALDMPRDAATIIAAQSFKVLAQGEPDGTSSRAQGEPDGVAGCAIEAFLAEMRQLSLCHSMKGII